MSDRKPVPLRVPPPDDLKPILDEFAVKVVSVDFDGTHTSHMADPTAIFFSFPRTPEGNEAAKRWFAYRRHVQETRTGRLRTALAMPKTGRYSWWQRLLFRWRDRS